MPAWPHSESRSKALYDRAAKVMPGGITRIQPWQDPFPVYAGRGEGAYVVDMDGTRRLDLLNNFASLIHGHAHPAIVEAATKRIALGTAFTLPTEPEVELAETICGRVAGFEWIRFSNSGSEAVMCAIKAARALTGRSKIVKVEGAYHGAYDYAEVSLDPDPQNWGNEPRSVGFSAGVPKGVTEDVVVIPYNDVDASERIVMRARDEVAAILLDPAPSYLGFTPISAEFARATEALARRIGALLILDEVISLRMHAGGAQTLYGITPDLTTMAKIIGGGFPVGAVAGPRSVMRVFDHRRGKPLLPWSGTFTANPVSMVAGKVSLDLLSQSEIDRIDALGTRFGQASQRFTRAETDRARSRAYLRCSGCMAIRVRSRTTGPAITCPRRAAASRPFSGLFSKKVTTSRARAWASCPPS
jgi:glutamate-1-semialdehyde 2,1-aminomutase